uniref:Nucleolin_bd domain-containing protein n=2 Tax=Bursaphelenchus xylophilus TaxID=6326 RepID=A0A1I7SW72_BURXY
MAPRVAEILLKKRIKECLEGGTLPEVSMISTELKNVYSEYTRYKEPLFISMITSALQGLQVEIIPSGMTPNKRKRQLPKKQVV